jgi:uncharacterized protein with HEPN domain
MLNKEDRIRLCHMLEAAREALELAKGRTRAELESDRSLTHSLVRCLEIIGEAASKVSKEYRQTNTQIEWDDMIGMRNRLVHAYFDINLNIVWRTVNKEVIPLVSAIEAIIESEGSND